MTLVIGTIQTIRQRLHDHCLRVLQAPAQLKLSKQIIQQIATIKQLLNNKCN